MSPGEPGGAGDSALEARPVASLKGVGPALQAALNRLGIQTVQDLLFHLPLRYEDRTRVVPIAHITVGQPAQIEGEVIETRLEPGRRRSLFVRVRDTSGQLGLRFYAFNKSQQARFTTGTRFRCYGDVRMGRSGFEMYHPECRVLEPGHIAELSDELMPVYPAVEGLAQRRLQSLVAQALDQLRLQPVQDWLPSERMSALGLPSLNSALFQVHHPKANTAFSLENGSPSRDRLAFEELVAHHLSLLKLRREVQSRRAFSLPFPAGQERDFRSRLPFALTAAQERVLTEIRSDLGRSTPMLRLVQGDVGSGKTVVAALSALTAMASGCQCALMAPTEILAEQHFSAMRRWFEPLGFSVVWLSGKQKVRERREALAQVSSGQARLVVGTHALFQDEVVFSELALVIVDEQHRFGVHQRLALQAKGREFAPHQLIMTATPIPRTLAMSAYADLDTSVIDELPPGRSPIITRAIADNRRDEVIERVRVACREGRQVYWVCTLIEESDALQCQAAEVTAQLLREQLPEISIGLVHGRLASAEKSTVMEQFARNSLQLLVATTVIEVGVDVPNASLMVIENPERLGLAQLHQLRGRVGRGRHQSFCLLLYHAPLSQNARSRLQALRESQDGFYIAERDLELRGPGELLGTRQTGVAGFRIADLERDGHWLEAVRTVACALPESSPAVEGLVHRWLGIRVQYAQV